MADELHNREDGFYWVRSPALGTAIAELANGRWWLTGDENQWSASAFEWIGDRIEPPAEPLTIPALPTQDKLRGNS